MCFICQLCSVYNKLYTKYRLFNCKFFMIVISTQTIITTLLFILLGNDYAWDNYPSFNEERQSIYYAPDKRQLCHIMRYFQSSINIIIITP